MAEKLMRRRLLVIALAMAGFLLAAGAREAEIVERWSEPSITPRAFKTLLIIGISGNREGRYHFEDKFVSHLRGSGIQAITSHSIVPVLGSVLDKTRILRMIEDEGVDGAITVRLVPLNGSAGTEWAGTWKTAAAEGGTIRELIERTLPISAQKADAYGAEVALWEADQWQKIWACRTGTLSRRDIRKRAGEFVQLVINDLKKAGLL